MVTLAQIETELARRTGPYEDHVVLTGTGTTLACPTLISSLDSGEYDERWVLRRAATNADDRQRRVALNGYANATGTLTVDRVYATIASGETIEIVALDPTRHLRQAARMGLSRCFFEDRVSIPSTIAAAERDLTDARAWLTRPGQLRTIEMLAVGSTSVPTPLDWWQWFQAGGHLQLQASPDPAPYQVYVTALRPHDSWVNGADSTTGPTADADTLAVDLEYAVIAAHKYLWEIAADRLAGYGKTAQQVDEGWRAQILGHIRPPPDRLQLGASYAGGAAEWGYAGFGTWAGVATTTWGGLASYTWSQLFQ